MAERAPTERIAARAILFGPEDRILLVRFSPPHALGVWWATPGGALDPGETLEEGLRRELLEEAGIAVESDAIAPQLDRAAEDVEEIRWWTLDELEASDEEFAPRRLPQLIRRLLDEGPPAQPFDAGV